MLNWVIRDVNRYTQEKESKSIYKVIQMYIAQVNTLVCLVTVLTEKFTFDIFNHQDMLQIFGNKVEQFPLKLKTLMVCLFVFNQCLNVFIFS